MAQRTRARCLIELDRIDEAELVLAELEQGAAELDQVWLIRAELALKQGKPRCSEIRDGASQKAEFQNQAARGSVNSAPRLGQIGLIQPVWSR